MLDNSKYNLEHNVISIVTRFLSILICTAFFAANLQHTHADEQTDAGGLSLKTDSKLAFTTDEGTWMSLDVMPDGSGIIFDLLGDIYRLPIKGGDATRLTSGLGFDWQPAISPDGKWIAFVSDRDGKENLWIVKSDGTEFRKLSSLTYESTTVISPQWSPDSDYILVTELTNKTNLKLYHRDGGRGVNLTPRGEKPGINGVGAVFSPDGQSIYFAEPTSGLSGGPKFPGAQIRRFDRDTGAITTVTQGVGGGFRPAISPDGRLLAYATRDKAKTQLRIRDLATGTDRELITDIQRDAQESWWRIPSRDYLPAYDFTPDSRHIVLTLDGQFHSVAVANGAAKLIPFSADVELDLGPDLTSPYRVEQGPVTARIVHDPRISNDGRMIAASVLGKIYITPAKEGSKSRRLTRSDKFEFNPVWSPDGRSIAFVTWSDLEGGHIWRMASNGSSKPKRLTQHPAFYSDLNWSPDGRHIVAMRGSAWERQQNPKEFGHYMGFVQQDFVYLPASGGKAIIIRPVRKGESAPHFAGASQRLYVYSGEALISMDFDGRDERTHLIVKGPLHRRYGENRYAQQVLARPGGAWALSLVNDQVWVMPMPALGVQAPTISVREPALPAVRLTDTGADFISWSKDGANVVWAIGSTVYTRPFDSIEFPTQKGAHEEKADKDKQTIPEMHEAVRAHKITVRVPRSTPEGAILLSGATIIMMAGDTTDAMSTGLDDSDILIVDNRIKAIGPKGSLNTPDNVEIIDVTGKTIIPGLIDTHAHWSYRMHDILEPHNWSLAANLAYGVTSGLDVQTMAKDPFTYRDFVDAGMTVGQRAFMTGPGIFSSTDFQSYERTLAYLRRYSDHYRTKNIKAYLVGNRQQRHWLAQAAKELGLMPTTEGAADLGLGLTHAIDGMHGYEHNLPILPLKKDVIELFAKTQTAVTSTLLVQYHALGSVEYFMTRFNPHDDKKLKRFYPKNRLDELTRRREAWAIDDEFAFAEAAASVAAIQRAGGLVGIGGHGELHGLGYHWEMQTHAFGGMTPPEILRAATIDGARIIGVSEDLGSLEVGKLADLIILNTDPRADIANAADIQYVMKNGELYEGDTLNRIWPTARTLAPFWWTESLK